MYEKVKCGICDIQNLFTDIKKKKCELGRFWSLILEDGVTGKSNDEDYASTMNNAVDMHFNH